MGALAADGVAGPWRVRRRRFGNRRRRCRARRCRPRGAAAVRLRNYRRNCRGDHLPPSVRCKQTPATALLHGLPQSSAAMRQASAHLAVRGPERSTRHPARCCAAATMLRRRCSCSTGCDAHGIARHAAAVTASEWVSRGVQADACVVASTRRWRASCLPAARARKCEPPRCVLAAGWQAVGLPQNGTDLAPALRHAER